jgi:hypothetical protein
MTPGKIRFSAIHAVLLLSLCLSLVGIWWGLPSYRGWAPDEILPSRVLEGMHQGFSSNWADKYPPLQYYLLSLLYLPFVLLQKLKVLDFPQLSTYTALFYMGRLLSVAMATATVYLVYRCGLEIYDKRSSLFAASITALIVPFVYHTKITNVDIPYLFWFVWSVFFFIRILKTHQTKYYLFFSLTAVCSICTKDQAYGLYILPLFLILIVDGLEARKAGRPHAFIRSLMSRKHLYALAAWLAAFLVLHNIFFNAEGLLNHVRLIGGRLSRDYRIYENTLSGHIHLFGLTIRQIQFSLGWPLFVVCGLGLIAALAAKKKNFLLLSLPAFGVSYYLFYIGIILYNYDRFNISLCIVLSFFGGKALSDAFAVGQKFFRARILAVAVLFLYAILYTASVDILMVKDSRYHAEQWMAVNIPKDAVIGVVGLLEYCPRLERFKWISLRPSLEALEKVKKIDYVLFNVDYSRSFAENTPGQDFFAQFYRDSSIYKLAFRYKTPLEWLFLKSSGVLTNINTINPEIRIFQKVGP